jgi:hypothetical protein
MDFEIGARIALKDQFDQLYSRAFLGSEGTILDINEDYDGFLMIYVSWDQEHWRYNGEPDGWTYASHFDVIAPPSKDLIDLPKKEDIEDFDQIDGYIDELASATDSASEGEGFILISVRRIPNPLKPHETIFVPSVYSSSLSEEATLLLNVNLVEIAKTNYEKAMFSMMNDHISLGEDG